MADSQVPKKVLNDPASGTLMGQRTCLWLESLNFEGVERFLEKADAADDFQVMTPEELHAAVERHPESESALLENGYLLVNWVSQRNHTINCR
jgi:hypothetical protein